jgi:acylglycerol lipase
VTQQSYAKPEYAETVALLTGVIATGPLIRQTTPASKLLRRMSAKLAIVTPYSLVPADIDAKVSIYFPLYSFLKLISPFRTCPIRLNSTKHISKIL